MKKFLLFTMALSFVFVAVAQKRALPPQKDLNLSIKKEIKTPIKDGAAENKLYKPGEKSCYKTSPLRTNTNSSPIYNKQ